MENNMKKIIQIAFFVVFVITVFYLPSMAEDNLTVEKLMAAPEKYLDKTVHVSGYMANMGQYGGKFGFALYDKKIAGKPAYSKPVVGVNANNLQRKDLQRLFTMQQMIRDNRGDGEGFILVKGVLKRKGNDYEINISEFSIVKKSDKKQVKNKTISELSQLDRQSRTGKLVNKHSSFRKESYQDENGRIWYEEDYLEKEFSVKGYIDVHGNFCENENREQHPCINIDSNVVSDAFNLQGMPLYDEATKKAFLKGEKRLPASGLIYIRPSKPITLTLRKIDFLSPQASKE